MCVHCVHGRLGSVPPGHDVETVYQRTLVLQSPSPTARVVETDFGDGFFPSGKLDFDGLHGIGGEFAVDGFLDYVRSEYEH